jgi:hypothetical protein
MLWKVIFIDVYVKMGSYMTMTWHSMAWQGMEMEWQWHGMERHVNGMEWKWHAMTWLGKE